VSLLGSSERTDFSFAVKPSVLVFDVLQLVMLPYCLPVGGIAGADSVS
jgi:hypothetical protein